MGYGQVLRLHQLTEVDFADKFEDGLYVAMVETDLRKFVDSFWTISKDSFGQICGILENINTDEVYKCMYNVYSVEEYNGMYTVIVKP